MSTSIAEPGDLVLLGVHSLEGLDLKVDPVGKELVSAGPVITASAAWVNSRIGIPACL